MDENRRRLLLWVAERVMPHERNVRARLRRTQISPDDIDDVIQESYCRLAALRNFEEIARPDAYFFSLARNLLVSQLRRRRVVQIDAIADIESAPSMDLAASPADIVGARQQLEHVLMLLGKLPERRRQVIEMRKIEGLSQKAIAERLGITESVVENELARGMKMIVGALRVRDEEGAAIADGMVKGSLA